jgi:uncharacterized protein
MSKTAKISIRLCLSAVFIYTAVALYFFAVQTSMLYHPSPELEGTPSDIGLRFTNLKLKTPDRLDISAWYIPARNSRGVILYCHGNAGNISHRLPLIRLFNRMRLDVLIFDYRGFGQSSGSPSEEGTYIDAETAWDYLVNTLRIKPGKILLYGHSLGGAVATEMALRHKAGGLIIDSGFKSVAERAGEMFPIFPVDLMVRHRYASIEKIGNSRMPKLIIHSQMDELIPFEHGMALFKRAAGPKRFLKLKGGHDDGALASGKLYIDTLDTFIKENL